MKQAKEQLNYVHDVTGTSKKKQKTKKNPKNKKTKTRSP